MPWGLKTLQAGYNCLPTEYLDYSLVIDIFHFVGAFGVLYFSESSGTAVKSVAGRH